MGNERSVIALAVLQYCIEHKFREFAKNIATILWSFYDECDSDRNIYHVSIYFSVPQKSWLGCDFLYTGLHPSIHTSSKEPPRGDRKGARSRARSQCAVVVWVASSSHKRSSLLPNWGGTPFQNRTINNFSNLSPAGSWVGDRFGSARVGK